MALSANREVDHYVDQQLRTFKVKGSTTIYKGALVGLDSGGFARGLVAGDKCVGVAYEKIVNSGTDGAVTVRVYTQGDFGLTLTGFAQANIGAPIYATDDDTLTLTASGASFVGYGLDALAANEALVRVEPLSTAP